MTAFCVPDCVLFVQIATAQIGNRDRAKTQIAFAEAFVIAAVIVVADEAIDLGFEIAEQMFLDNSIKTSPSELRSLLKNLQKNSRIAEKDLHVLVISCARARQAST